MDVLNQLRSSFRSRSNTSQSSSGASSDGSSSSLNSSMDSNNNDAAVHSKKRGKQMCQVCGKRLLKLAGWRNYFTLPCRCQHVFCKQCIMDRLHCRQKVLRSASFELMWTFPCPGSAQCHQQLTVDFSRGSSYSKNMVARDIDSGDEENSWEQDEVEMDVSSDNVLDESDASMSDSQDEGRLREIG